MQQGEQERQRIALARYFAIDTTLPAARIAARIEDELQSLVDAQNANFSSGWSNEGFTISHPIPGMVLLTLVGSAAEHEGGTPALKVVPDGPDTINLSLAVSRGGTGRGTRPGAQREQVGATSSN